MVRERENGFTPDMLRSQLEIEISSISSERMILEVINQGKRLAFILIDRTRIIFGGGNLHTPLEQAMAINEHDNLYVKGSVQKSNGKIRVEYTSDTYDSPKKFRQMYGVAGDGYLDYSAEVEMKVIEFIKKLQKQSRKK